MWQETDTLEQVTQVCELQQKQIDKLDNVPHFENVRRTGTITAMDVRVKDGGYLSQIGTQLYLEFQQSGILLRPLGNTIYVLPPYCITAADLDFVYSVIVEKVSELA